MAEPIRGDDLLNHRLPRFPPHPSLTVDVWRYKLRDYHDKLLIQYLTYGFPLSSVDSNLSCSTEVSKHYSALQFPVASKQYLEKEIQLGAIVGPYEAIDHHHRHCSPLLTRPKDDSKMVHT